MIDESFFFFIYMIGAPFVVAGKRMIAAKLKRGRFEITIMCFLRLPAKLLAIFFQYIMILESVFTFVTPR